MTDNQPIKPTEGIELKADVQDDQSVKTVKLRYRTNRHEDFKEVPLKRIIMIGCFTILFIHLSSSVKNDWNIRLKRQTAKIKQ